MSTYEYIPKGVCSRRIHIELAGSKVEKVFFEGGCNGNLQGISKLIEGMEIDAVIRRLAGIRCGRRQTSCPDQLSLALQAARNAQAD
mgnify:FL=1